MHHDLEDKAGKRVKQATEDDPGEQDKRGKGSYQFYYSLTDVWAARVGIGGDFDVKMRADATKSERFRDFDIYQAELSFEIDSEVGIAWEYLSFYQ